MKTLREVLEDAEGKFPFEIDCLLRKYPEINKNIFVIVEQRSNLLISKAGPAWNLDSKLKDFRLYELIDYDKVTSNIREEVRKM